MQNLFFARNKSKKEFKTTCKNHIENNPKRLVTTKKRKVRKGKLALPLIFHTSVITE